MLGHSPFYHTTIKNVVAAFGGIFNDISIIRTKGNKTQTVKVPLVYSSADKAFSRRTEDPTLNYNMQGKYPRAAFMMTGFQYDPTRKTSPMHQHRKDGLAVYSPVPYDINLELYIASANMEDGLQIIEQILPFFNPEFTLTAEMLPTIGLKKDVPIILDSVAYNDPAPDSSYEELRLVEWTLTFTAKAYIFGPTTTKTIIKESTLNIFDKLPFSDPDNQLETITSEVVPRAANEDEPHVIEDSIVINTLQRV